MLTARHIQFLTALMCVLMSLVINTVKTACSSALQPLCPQTTCCAANSGWSSS